MTNLLKTSLKPDIRMEILRKNRRDQITLFLGLLLTEPIVSKIAYHSLLRMPFLGPALKNKQLMERAFKRVIDASAAAHHFYSITKLLRDGIDLELKLAELGHLSAASETFMSTFLRHSDTGILRKKLLALAKEERFQGIYSRLVPQLSEENADAVIKRLGELSPVFKMSPYEHIVEMAGLVMAVYGAEAGWDWIESESDGETTSEGAASANARASLLNSVLLENPKLKEELDAAMAKAASKK